LTAYVSKLQILSFHGAKVTHQSFVVGMDGWMHGGMHKALPNHLLSRWMDGWMDGYRSTPSSQS